MLKADAVSWLCNRVFKLSGVMLILTSRKKFAAIKSGWEPSVPKVLLVRLIFKITAASHALND